MLVNIFFQYTCILYNLHVHVFYRGRGNYIQYSICIPFIKVHVYNIFCCTLSLNTKHVKRMNNVHVMNIYECIVHVTHLSVCVCWGFFIY